jgi:hypothetical protein
VADEMGLDFPKPFFLQMDNTAAIAFSKNTCFKSKLKHIDVRQEWVRTLRNKDIMLPVHVSSALNLADILTKILSTAEFLRMRERLLFAKPKSA